MLLVQKDHFIIHRKLLIVLPSDLLVSHLIVFLVLFIFSSGSYMARRYLNKNVFCAYYVFLSIPSFLFEQFDRKLGYISVVLLV